MIASLAYHLNLLPDVLASVHEANAQDARADQARSMARVARVLEDQVRAYVGMIDEEIGGPRRR